MREGGNDRFEAFYLSCREWIFACIKMRSLVLVREMG